MTSSLLWERYEELMQSSAAALDQLKDAGFDRNSTAHGPRQSEVLGDQSIPLMREAGHPNPIVLSSSSSSSSSDSEDDVPLSLRLKKGKVGVQPGTAAIRTAAPASDIQDPPLGNAISHADPRQAGVEQPEIGNKSSDARTSGFAQRTAQGAESQAKTSPLSSPPPKRRKKEPQKTAGSPQQQNIRGGPRQKEGVIDLEADKDSDMEFVTAAPPLPTRKTSLKHLQKMNPGLARAVQERVHSNLRTSTTSRGPDPLQKVAGNYLRKQAKSGKPQQPQAGVQRVKPNWGAAGSSFWASLSNSLPKTGTTVDKGKANERLKRKSKTSQEADEGIQLASESRQAAPIPQKPATKPTKAPSKFTPKASPATRKRKAPEPAVDTAPTSQQTQQEKSLHQPEPERPLKRSRQQGSPDSRPQASSAEAESTAQGRSATAEPEAVSEMAGDADAQQDSEGLDEGMPMRDRSTEAGNLEESDRNVIEDEEWKARRLEVEKQALEARLLKKKRRAETDLKNRAEVRVNEYRNAEAAREVAITEKETLRATYRAGLKLRLRGKSKLRDILLALGCQVNGADPGSVNKAYRKALLHFHPDRHVTSPVASQIYAEEAFKIISEAAKS